MQLAREIVSIYHNEADAVAAEEAFIRIFQKGDIPQEMPEFSLQAGQTVLDVLVAGKLVNSKSDGRRMIDQKGVRLDGETLVDPNQIFPHAGVLQVGKRRFLLVVA